MTVANAPGKEDMRKLQLGGGVSAETRGQPNIHRKTCNALQKNSAARTGLQYFSDCVPVDIIDDRDGFLLTGTTLSYSLL